MHDGMALIVNSSGIPDESFFIFHPHASLQGYQFWLSAFSQKSHLSDFYGNHCLSLRWGHCSCVKANQLHKRLKKIR
jgi:hypothetical protein